MTSLKFEPKCLIDTGPNGELVVNRSVLEHLKSLDKHLVVVVIAGPYRTGKSYLMNQLAGQNKGFALGSTVQSKTKGIWIWIRDHPIDPDCYLVLLDTEGLGDVEKVDVDSDNRILCLSLLLSSTFIYNAMRVIEDEAIGKLQYLFFITELSKHFQTQKNRSRNSESGFHFPRFVFVLRDFTLDLEIDGREVDADEYLEHAITLKPGSSEKVRSFNNTRQCIRTNFEIRKCFTFVPPVMDPKRMRCLDQVRTDELCPEFREETGKFVEYIFNRSSAKRVRGKCLTGSAFASLVEIYTKHVQVGMPHVEDAVEAMAQLENERAKKEALSLYCLKMVEYVEMPVPDDEKLDNIHGVWRRKALDMYSSRAMPGGDQTVQQQLERDIENNYNDRRRTNEKMCKEICLEEIRELYRPIQEKQRRGHYAKNGGFNEYEKDMKQMRDQCERNLGHLGRKLRPAILPFLQSKQAEGEMIFMTDQRIAAAERQKKADQRRTQELEKHKEEAEMRRAFQQNVMRIREEEHRREIERLEERRRFQEEIERQMFEEILSRRMEEQDRNLRKRFRRDNVDRQRVIDELNRQQTCHERVNDDDECVIL